MVRVPQYAVDVIIPVHSASRPIARAVGSVIDHTDAPARVTVIAHNIDPAIIRTGLGAYAEHPHLRLLALADGIPSPAGPMNLGFAEASAPFTALLGSDDEFAPGAIDSWLRVQRDTGADAVFARIRLAGGATDPYPPVRRGTRRRELDGEADRLAYRSAPLGLVSRERFPDLRMTEGVGSGEDLVYSLTTWFTGRHLAYDLDGPGYVCHGDAEDRVTAAKRPLAEDFGFLDALERTPWFVAAGTAVREAILVKIIRMHVFDALRSHLASDSPDDAVADDFRALLGRIAGLAPRVERLLSVADGRVLSALRDDEFDPARLTALLAARQRYTHPSAILTRNPLAVFHRQAPFRTLLAGALLQRRHGLPSSAG